MKQLITRSRAAVALSMPVFVQVAWRDCHAGMVKSFVTLAWGTMSFVKSPDYFGLMSLDKPADVVRAGAQCLAEMLDGFVWVRSRQSLERVSGGRREVITLEKSHWNRAGRLIQFDVTSLAAHDQTLGSWRRANPALTVQRPDSEESVVCCSSFLDMSKEHFIVLTDPDMRLRKLKHLAEHLKETALPWFAATANPQQLAQSAPDSLLRPWGFAQDLIEFLVSREAHEEARSLVERVRSLHPSHVQAFDAGRHMAELGERPRWQTPEALGWSFAVLGLD